MVLEGAKTSQMLSGEAGASLSESPQSGDHTGVQVHTQVRSWLSAQTRGL